MHMNLKCIYLSLNFDVIVAIDKILCTNNFSNFLKLCQEIALMKCEAINTVYA